MRKSVSETSEKVVAHHQLQLKRKLKEAPLGGMFMGTLGGRSGFISSELRAFAELIVDRRKVDARRAVFTLDKTNKEWSDFALRVFDETAARVCPKDQDGSGLVYEAVNIGREGERKQIAEVRNWLAITLDDQHAEEKVAARDKAIKWSIRMLFAAGGYAFKALLAAHHVQ